MLKFWLVIGFIIGITATVGRSARGRSSSYRSSTYRSSSSRVTTSPVTLGVVTKSEVGRSARGRSSSYRSSSSRVTTSPVTLGVVTKSEEASKKFSWNGNEYYLGKIDTTWQEARDICRIIWGEGNGDLVTINDREENDALFDLTRRDNRYMAWIGANDLISEGNFVWTDNSPLQFSRWSGREPNNFNNEDCAHFLGDSNGYWNDVICCSKMWFICERSLQSDTHDSGCYSSKWQTGNEGRFTSMNYPLSYNKFANCTWHISVPTSQKIHLTFSANFGLEKNLINGKCNDLITVYEGSNSNGIKIGPFCGKVAPADIILNSNQAFITFTSDRVFEYKGFSVHWQAIYNLSYPTIHKWNGGEYYLGKYDLSWQEARDACNKIWSNGNGDLVTINDAEENDYLYNLAENNIVWIGANDIMSEGKFFWTDDNPVRFSSWVNGEPNNYNNEDCVHFWKYGEWNDSACCTKMWFICERKRVNNN